MTRRGFPGWRLLAGLFQILEVPVKKKPFDQLIDDLLPWWRAHNAPSAAVRRPLRKSLFGHARRLAASRNDGPQLLLAKAQQAPQPASLRAARHLMDAQRQAASNYNPSGAVDERALRRVAEAAKNGALTPDDVAAVQRAHAEGLAMPGHVLRKLAEAR